MSDYNVLNDELIQRLIKILEAKGDIKNVLAEYDAVIDDTTPFEEYSIAMKNLLDKCLEGACDILGEYDLSLVNTLYRIMFYKNRIRDAVAAKGVDIDSDTLLADYATKIASIQGIEPYLIDYAKDILGDFSVENISDALDLFDNIKRTFTALLRAYGVDVNVYSPFVGYPELIQGLLDGYVPDVPTPEPDPEPEPEPTPDPVNKYQPNIPSPTATTLTDEQTRRQVSDLAKSYLISRLKGDCIYTYSQSYHPYNGDLNYDGGYGIDCSTFVGLILRGIPFIKSMYYTSSDGTCDPSDLHYLCLQTPYAWANPYLDLQEPNSYVGLRDIGLEGWESVRTAACQAEYYYNSDKIEQVFTSLNTSSLSSLPARKPGDIIFWSRNGDNGRFWNVSHVGIVANDTDYFYEVSTPAGVVLYTSIEAKLANMTAIIRPNYKSLIKPSSANTNIFPTYEYSGRSALAGQAVITENGLTFTLSVYGGFYITGTSNASMTFYMNYSSDKYYITLQPGTYQLSGCPNNPNNTTDTTATDKAKRFRIGIKDSAGNELVRQANGVSETFTVTSTTKVYGFVYVASGQNMNDTEKVMPKLIKIS